MVQPVPPAVTIDVVSSCRGAVGETPQAVITREANATRTRVRWRRDMGDSRMGADDEIERLPRT
jgi:hypothetical protein